MILAWLRCVLVLCSSWKLEKMEGRSKYGTKQSIVVAAVSTFPIGMQASAVEACSYAVLSCRGETTIASAKLGNGCSRLRPKPFAVVAT